MTVPKIIPRAENPRAMLTPALKKRVDEKIAWCVAKAIELYPDKKWPTPKYSFDIASKVGGLAYSGKWFMRFNIILCYENEDHFIDVVVPHEFVHLVVGKVHGHVKTVVTKGVEKVVKIRPHGSEWRNMMILFGQMPRTTHSYHVGSIPQRPRKRRGSLVSEQESMAMLKRLQNGVKRLPMGAKLAFSTWIRDHLEEDAT